LIKKLTYRVWLVGGDSGDEYYISYDNGKWKCTCPGYLFHGKICKHIRRVMEELKEVEM
jgi:predicted nucleic acid-binding Zn finger protein